MSPMVIRISSSVWRGPRLSAVGFDTFLIFLVMFDCVIKKISYILIVIYFTIK
jgi:hypothetical protein